MRKWIAAFLMSSGLAFIPACGAGDRLAPYTPPPPQCDSIDGYLAELYAVADAGGVANLSRLIRDELSDPLRRDVVDAVLRLLRAFEPRSFSSLSDALLNAEETDQEGRGLQASLALLLDYIATGDGRGADLAFLESFRRTLASCEGAPVFQVLSDVLRDEELIPSLVALIVDLDLAQLLRGLEFESAQGRAALQRLVRNLFVSASAPGFDLPALIELLSLIVGSDTLEREPYAGTLRGLERSLLALSEEGDTGLKRMQGFLTCLRETDAEMSIGGFLYDVIASGVLLEVLGSGEGATASVVIAPEMRELLAELSDFMALDALTRRALVGPMMVLLEARHAPLVVSDLAHLLEAEALSGIFELLVALASGECRAPNQGQRL